MQLLSALDIVRIWESGAGQAPLDRALTILSAAFPELKRDDFGRFSLGRLNRLLLSLRERLFGADFHCTAACPGCSEHLEFTVAAAALKGEDSLEPVEEHQLSVQDFDLRFRLLHVQDLCEIAGGADKAAMRRQLVGRCVIDARQAGAEVPADLLPETVISRLAARLAECDQQAEAILDLQCPSCNKRIEIAFDIATYFWEELSTQAKRLLREVHALASAYGWREAEILSMSARRRHFYLALISP